MSSRVALCMAIICLGGCQQATRGPRTAPVIPRDAARFDIDAVDDSTARFRLKEVRWIRPGMSVYAVDALQRDALVARLRVLSIDGESATALVTSQVARVNTSHVLLVSHAARPWWRAAQFWSGAAIGTVLGATAVSASK